MVDLFICREGVSRSNTARILVKDSGCCGRHTLSETDKEELARLMVGREVLFRLEKKQRTRSEPVLEVKNLEALSDKGILALKNFTFKPHGGGFKNENCYLERLF